MGYRTTFRCTMRAHFTFNLHIQISSFQMLDEDSFWALSVGGSHYGNLEPGSKLLQSKTSRLPERECEDDLQLSAVGGMNPKIIQIGLFFTEVKKLWWVSWVGGALCDKWMCKNTKCYINEINIYIDIVQYCHTNYSFTGKEREALCLSVR